MNIDLNSDLGESFGQYTFGSDELILDSISSANIACGFHAGDPHGIRSTARAAVERGVAIGAHPGYRDLPGFGRRFIDMNLSELTDEVIYQIGAVQALARSVGGQVQYVKPHGALYNTIAVHEAQAGAVVRAIIELSADLEPELPLMVLPGSVIERVAQDAGLITVAEAFADRGYLPDGTLVKRGTPGAMLSATDAVAQAIRLAEDGTVVAADGTVISTGAQSICLHGDSPGAVQLAPEIRSGLEAAGVEIRSFV